MRIVGALFAGVVGVLTSILVLCLVHTSPLKETRQWSHSVEECVVHSFNLSLPLALPLVGAVFRVAEGTHRSVG